MDAVGGARFGEGEGRIWLSNVRCVGTEQEILECRSNSTGITSCLHAQDAGIRCGKLQNV